MGEQNQHVVDQELEEAVEAFVGDFDSVHLFARLAAFRQIFRYDFMPFNKFYWQVVKHHYSANANFMILLWGICYERVELMNSTRGGTKLTCSILMRNLSDKINLVSFDYELLKLSNERIIPELVKFMKTSSHLCGNYRDSRGRCL